MWGGGGNLDPPTAVKEGRKHPPTQCELAPATGLGKGATDLPSDAEPQAHVAQGDLQVGHDAVRQLGQEATGRWLIGFRPELAAKVWVAGQEAARRCDKQLTHTNDKQLAHGSQMPDTNGTDGTMMTGAHK